MTARLNRLPFSHRHTVEQGSHLTFSRRHITSVFGGGYETIYASVAKKKVLLDNTFNLCPKVVANPWNPYHIGESGFIFVPRGENSISLNQHLEGFSLLKWIILFSQLYTPLFPTFTSKL